MKKIAKNYEEHWSENDQTNISNADDFIDSLKKLMEVDTTFRNIDSYVPSFKNNNDEIRLKKIESYYVLNYRKNLTVINKGEIGEYYNLQIMHTGLQQLKVFKPLFTSEEYQAILSLGETPEALEVMLQTLMPKFFDKRNFTKIISLSGQPSEKSAAGLFIVFSGLQPFSDPLSNRVAARLYCDWILKNHFPKEKVGHFRAINELNSVLNDYNNFASPYWYGSQN